MRMGGIAHLCYLLHTYIHVQELRSVFVCVPHTYLCRLYKLTNSYITAMLYNYSSPPFFYTVQPQLGRPSCCPLGSVAAFKRSMSVLDNVQSSTFKSCFKYVGLLALTTTAVFLCCTTYLNPTSAAVRLYELPTEAHKGSVTTWPWANGE